MRLHAALMPLVVGVMAAVLAPSALAAFPGTNGLLVIAPAHGGGLQLIDPHGHGLRQICTDPGLCGSPAAPHFSPNGQQITFGDRSSGRPVVVAADGTCLWCLLGPRLNRLAGATPAYKPGGQSLSFSSGPNLWTTTLSGGATTRTPTPGGHGTITGAVWSQTGALAFVRAGSVWLIRPGRGPRNLGIGSAPTFSPDAKRLAFVRQGWIWVVNVTGGKAARLVRGSAPAYSPDGRSLAFIAHGNNVYVVGARGGRSRLVPGVQARSLDWQPLTATSSGRCSVPAGSTVQAQSADALVTYAPSTPLTPWYGCLQATGRRWPLVTLPGTSPATSSALGQIQLAGRFAAFVLTTTDTSMNCSNALSEVDLGSGAATRLYSQSCTGASRGVDSLALDSSAFAAWRTHQQIATAQPLTGVACPSSSLCVAVDGHGNAATSTTPSASSSWTLTKVAPPLANVVCPSTTLCIGLAGGQIVTTTNPAGGPSAWSAPVSIDSAPIADVSCVPSATLCVAVDNVGNALTSTNPTGGAAAWQATTIDPGSFLSGVSCPSSTLCVAVDDVGNALTSTNPTGGAAAWQATTIDPGSFLSGVSCPSSTLCVAVGQNGDVLTSTRPTAGALAWSKSNAESTFGLGGVDCPTTSFCLSTDSSGNVLSKSAPVTGGGPWTVVHVPGETGFLYQPVCPSTSLCLARDGGGNVVVSTNPASPSATWTATSLGGTLSGLSCEHTISSSPLCAASDDAGEIHVSTNPASGAASWSAVGVDVPACAPCIAEQLYAHDDRATQALDAVQPGAGNVLADAALGGNSRVLSWRHGGAPRSYPLR
jgi:WD40 repeat protein